MTAASHSLHVVAIAAPIGGGKTTLSKALAQALGEKCVLAFDDYETATKMPPAQLQAWLENGADFAVLQASGLSEALHALLRGEQVTGLDGVSASARRFVIFEMPLGRTWPATAAAIDTLIWLDVPPDLALARRIRDITTNILTQDAVHAQGGVRWLNGYLEHYVSLTHAVLAAQRQVVRPDADLVLDGTRPIEEMIATIEQHVRQKEHVS